MTTNHAIPGNARSHTAGISKQTETAWSSWFLYSWPQTPITERFFLINSLFCAGKWNTPPLSWRSKEGATGSLLCSAEIQAFLVRETTHARQCTVLLLFCSRWGLAIRYSLGGNGLCDCFFGMIVSVSDFKKMLQKRKKKNHPRSSLHLPFYIDTSTVVIRSGLRATNPWWYVPPAPPPIHPPTPFLLSRLDAYRIYRWCKSKHPKTSNNQSRLMDAFQ